MTQGLKIFRSLREAKDAGFDIYDRTPDGYLVRIKTEAGYQFALVIPGAEEKERL